MRNDCKIVPFFYKPYKKPQKTSVVNFSFACFDKKVCNLSGIGNCVKANKILEINPNHPIFKVLQEEASNTETLKDYSEVLYDQALLIQGLPIEDPVTYSRKITDLLIKASK